MLNLTNLRTLLAQILSPSALHTAVLFTPEGQLQAVFGNAVGARYTQTDSGLKKVTGKLDEAAAHALGQKLWGGPVFGPRLVDLSWATGARSGEELHGTNAPLQLGEDARSPAATSLVSMGWLAVAAYTWFAPGVFQRMLRRELEQVQLRSDF